MLNKISKLMPCLVTVTSKKSKVFPFHFSLFFSVFFFCVVVVVSVFVVVLFWPGCAPPLIFHYKIALYSIYCLDNDDCT